MEALKAFLDLILPPSTRAERRKAALAVFHIGVLAFVLWGMGWLGVIGYPGLARANDVDDKIEQAVKPINQKLDALAQVTQQIRIDQVAARIRDLQMAYCATTDHDVANRLALEIETSQLEYRRLTGDRYPVQSCVR